MRPAPDGQALESAPSTPFLQAVFGGGRVHLVQRPIPVPHLVQAATEAPASLSRLAP